MIHVGRTFSSRSRRVQVSLSQASFAQEGNPHTAPDMPNYLIVILFVSQQNVNFILDFLSEEIDTFLMLIACVIYYSMHFLLGVV